MYAANGNKIFFGDDLRAQAATPEAAAEAVALLNKARHLNDVKRQYTNAARAINKAENVAGFEWIEGEATP